MASKVLDLLIKVTDQASEQLEAIKGSTTGEGAGIEGLGESMLAFAGKAVIAGMALQKIGGYVEEGIDEYTDYALGVNALAEAFGLTTNEAETLMLTADAMNVSNDALFSTMNKLARDGFGTGIDALAGLREAFLAVADPAAAAELLFSTAGEQGQKVLGPLLTMSDIDFTEFIAGMKEAAFLTDEEVQTARELDLAVKGVEQSWNKLKLSLIEFSAPGLTNLLNQMNMLMGGDFSASGPTGFERWGGTAFDMQSGTNVGSPNTGMMADRDRWDAIADSMADKVGTAVKDAVERID